jgi:hypothetical protein
LGADEVAKRVWPQKNAQTAEGARPKMLKKLKILLMVILMVKNRSMSPAATCVDTNAYHVNIYLFSS